MKNGVNETNLSIESTTTHGLKKQAGVIHQTIDDGILGRGSIKEIPQMFSEIPEGYTNNVAHRGNYTEEEMDDT